jgi:hypothetical protein
MTAIWELQARGSEHVTKRKYPREGQGKNGNNRLGKTEEKEPLEDREMDRPGHHMLPRHIFISSPPQ